MPRHNNRPGKQLRSRACLCGCLRLLLVLVLVAAAGLFGGFKGNPLAGIVPQSYNPPSYIKDTVAYKEGSNGLVVYLILSDADGQMTRSSGVTTLKMYNPDNLLAYSITATLHHLILSTDARQGRICLQRYDPFLWAHSLFPTGCPASQHARYLQDKYHLYATWRSDPNGRHNGIPQPMKETSSMYQQPTKRVQQRLYPYCSGGNSMDMYECQWCHRKPPEPHDAE